ncbi:MAG: hypothetical protein E7231_08515 [Cellulosilyticum sp.]|nr:hypothetical protein [Cellulosilyticum sp.]
MKKLAILAISLALMVSSTYAAEGEMGCFGGISTGIKMETLTALAQTSKKKTTSKYTLPYKENIYLTGQAETVEGTVEIKPGKGVDKEKTEGTYTETYKMTAQNSDGTTKVTRNVTLEVQYKYDAALKQTTKNTTMKKWSEIITVNGKTYKLDSNLSEFSKSILEDYTPGVLYYRGDVHYNAVYTPASGGNTASNITVSVNSPIYGYEQAFAKSETQQRTITVDLGSGEGYAIEETPTFTVYRDIEYGVNEPTAISMAGNYKEVMRSEGALSYNILQGNASLYEDDYSGMIGVQSSPTIEQLSYPTGLKLTGHAAETQLKKMFSMKIFSNDAASFSPNAVVSKKDYITMLVKALQIELPEEESKNKRSSKKKNQQVNPFTDLSSSDAYYRYAVAAYNAGLVDGGAFDGNSTLTRESMYVINMRAIGLQRLGLATADAYTAFVDDNQIGNWAKSSIYAAAKLGIINSANGYVYPKKTVTYADCATFLDQLINYLRYELQKDYIDKMLL